MKIEMAAASDTGRVREHNEDSIFIVPEAGLAVLADGMGGHQAGEVASHIATDIITGHLTDFIDDQTDADGRTSDNPPSYVDNLIEAIQAANTSIIETAAQRPECSGMGATIVAACFHDGRLSAAHLGDSRMYRLRGGRLEQLTEDHSLVQEFVSQGMLKPEEARLSMHKNLITRALGIGETVDPVITEGPLEENDIYLLCSDGLTDVVLDERIEATLNEPGIKLDEAVAHLIDMANTEGGPDNISVVLVRILSLENDTSQ